MAAQRDQDGSYLKVVPDSPPRLVPARPRVPIAPGHIWMTALTIIPGFPCCHPHQPVSAIHKT